MPGLNPLLHGPGTVWIVLQQLLIMIGLDDQRVHFAQALDHGFGGIPEIGDESERAGAAVESVTNRIDRIVRDRKGLDVDIADGKISAGPEEPPVAVFT